MNDLVDFELWLTQKGRKINTVRKLSHTIKRVQRLCGSFSKERVSSYLFQLHTEGKKATYINSIITDLWAYSHFKDLPELREIRLFKELPALKATLSDQEIEDFLSLPVPTCRWNRHGKDLIRVTDPKGWNQYTMFWTIMAYSGMRCGEVAALTVDRVDFGRGIYILEDTKTNDPRYVPIADSVIPKLKEYLSTVEGEYLFPSRRGGKEKGVVIDNVDWHYNFHKRIKTLGIKRKALTPYSFRHSFATSLLPNSTLFDTMEILGHKDPKTTMQYYHRNIQTMKRALEKLPLNLKTPFDKLRILREFTTALRLSPIEFNVVFTNTKIAVEIK